ncbi:MAG TPA: M20/M25/M40 family metallo-hydrolase [Thermoanaerobaculia bacterium]|nr:M20/M25/M40 family metallo-hydrolase [Thermoanaerobaculia bacterium]
MMGHDEIRRRQRVAARVALYSSLSLTTVAAVVTLPHLERRMAPDNPEWTHRDYRNEPAVTQLRELVRIDTTAATGREIDAARYLAAQLRDMGLEPVVEELMEGKANLWAVLEGERPEALVLHNHLDTDNVPDPSVWRHDPFAGAIEGPWIYGRGVFDMKSVAVAQLEAVRAVQERVRETGRRPPRSLVFLATSSEETGSELGARWIVEQHPDLVSRFWALLTEGGVIEVAGNGKIKYFGVSFAQKWFVRLTACSASRGQLEQLQRALQEHESPRRVLTPEVREFLPTYGPSREEPLLRERASVPESGFYGSWTFRFLPSYLKALYRNEVHPLQVVADANTGGYRMDIVLHLLPGEDLDQVRGELLPEWMIHGVRIVDQDAGPAAPGSPLDHPVFQGLGNVVRRRYETDAVGPYFLTIYDNDARFFRAAGVPSYGFSPFIAFTPDSFTVGGVDERITLGAFVEGVDLYREVVLSLLDRDAR